MSQDYKNTLNLPQTDFSMQAGLPKKEPVMLEKWEQDGIYDKLMKKNEGKPRFVCMTALHMPMVTSIWVLH